MDTVCVGPLRSASALDRGGKAGRRRVGEMDRDPRCWRVRVVVVLLRHGFREGIGSNLDVSK